MSHGMHAQLMARLQAATRPWLLPMGVPSRAPVHPGRFLERQFLKPLGLTQGQAARLLGVSRRRLNEIVVGRRSLSPDTALRCAMAFGLDTGFWMGLQARWDSFQAWQAWRAESAALTQACAPALRPATPALPRQKASAPHAALAAAH